MNGIIRSKTVHQCLFCTQTFDSAIEKDDHILEHFAQETCGDCNRSLIRIGANLYTLHDTSTCIKRITKREEHSESCFVDNITTEMLDEDEIRVKTEPVATADSQCISFKILPPFEFLPLVSVGAVTQKTEQEYEQQDSKTDDCHSDEDYSEGVHSVSIETICENELQIKAEPTFDAHLEQPGIQHTLEWHEIASISKSHSEAENLFREGDEFCGVNDTQSSQHFPSDVHANIMGNRIIQKPSASNNKEQFQCDKKSKSVECNICGRILAEKRTLHRHKIGFHSKPDTQFCTYCTRIFETVDELAQHVPECQLKKQGGPVECVVYKKTRKSRCSYQKHMQLTHNPDNKFRCKLCTAYFRQETALQNHYVFHNRGAQLPCKVCGRIFSSSNNLKRHMVRKHSKAGIH